MVFPELNFKTFLVDDLNLVEEVVSFVQKQSSCHMLFENPTPEIASPEMFTSVTQFLPCSLELRD